MNVCVRHLLLVGILASFCIAADTAQDSQATDAEGQLVERIDFLPSEQPLPRDELLALLRFSPGNLLRGEDVRASLQSLFSTGRFSDIAVEAERSGGGVIVRVITEPTYFIGGVTISGIASPPNRNQLLNTAKLELGTPFSDQGLQQAVASMRERLLANGLYRSRIATEVERNPLTEEATIHFDLTANQRARFDGIRATGSPVPPLERLGRVTRWRRTIGPLLLPGWRQVTETRVETGLARIRQDLQKENRLQARVTLDRMDYHENSNSVTPELTIEGGPVMEVRAVGAGVSQSRLRSLVPVFEERAVDRSLLIEGTRNITDYLQSRGFFEAEVDFIEPKESEGKQVIEYTINRNRRHKLVAIEFTGNTFFDEATLRERMTMTEAGLLRYRRGRYSQKLRDRDRNAIADLYRSNGFLDVVVNASTLDDYMGRPDELAVRIEIKEGPLWLVNQIAIEGALPEQEAAMRATMQSSPGQPFSATSVAADRDAILGYLFNLGYPDAQFEWSQTPASEPNHADLHYVVRTGERQFVRDILVRGLDATDPDLVESRISLKPGDPLSQGRLAETQLKLYDLGIFSRVQTALQNPNGRETKRVVLFQFDEAAKYSFNLGLGAELGRIGGGVTTFDSPAGATGFSPRVSAGLSRSNFFGVGHTVNFQARASTLQQRGVVSYVAPQFKGREDLSLTVSALFDVSRNVRTFSARRWESSVALSQKLSRANTIQYRFSFRRVTLDENTVKVSRQLIPLLSQPVRVGQASISFVQDKRDNPTDSHRGIYNTLDAGVSIPQFGSETDFTRLVLRNSTYHPLRRDVTLARTVQFGYTQRLGGLAQIPFAERFFAGGAFSHRGFPDNQAGPRDVETGFPLGGTALLFHSTELRFPLLRETLGGVLFHDMGNVYSSIREVSFRLHQRDKTDFDYMVHAVGFGIRYKTPVGPVRIDLSYGPNAPRFFGFQGTREQLLAGTGIATDQRISRFQFHFSLGQTF